MFYKLLHSCNKKHWTFSQSWIISETVCFYWLLYAAHFSRWCPYKLAFETSGLPYVLKLASGNLTAELPATPSANLSRAETDQFTPFNSSSTVSSPIKSLIQTGFKIESDSKRNKTWAGAKTGKVQWSCFLRSLMLQLACFSDRPQV